MILFHAADLIWATKIKGAADALGLPARPVRSVEMLRARLADSPVRALMVDLDQPDVGVELIRTLRSHEAASQSGTAAVRILAYGPHVNAEAFAEARRAGADVAMARGGLDARLGEVLRSLSGDAG